MAISVSSYEIIFPDSREIIIVNAQPGEHADNLIVVNPSPTQEAMIQCYEDIQSVLFCDGGPAYTTRVMELKTDHGSVATPIFLDGSNVLDHEMCVRIRSYILDYESEKILQHAVKIGGNMNNEEEVCVICQRGCQTGEMFAALECKHWYHEDCIEKWLQQKNNCPICRAEVFPFLSLIYRSRVGRP